MLKGKSCQCHTVLVGRFGRGPVTVGPHFLCTRTSSSSSRLLANVVAPGVKTHHSFRIGRPLEKARVEGQTRPQYIVIDRQDTVRGWLLQHVKAFVEGIGRVSFHSDALVGMGRQPSGRFALGRAPNDLNLGHGSAGCVMVQANAEFGLAFPRINANGILFAIYRSEGSQVGVKVCRRWSSISSSSGGGGLG